MGKEISWRCPLRRRPNVRRRRRLPWNCHRNSSGRQHTNHSSTARKAPFLLGQFLFRVRSQGVGDTSNSGAIAPMPSRARLLAEYFTSMVVDATTNLDYPPTLRCRRRPRHRRCSGIIFAVPSPDEDDASLLPGGILRRHADCAGPIAGGDSRSFAGKEHPVLDIAATVDCPKGGATVQTAVDLVASMASKRARFGALIGPAVGSDQREGSRGRHGSGAALLAVMEIQKPGSLAGCGRLLSL